MTTHLSDHIITEVVEKRFYRGDFFHVTWDKQTREIILTKSFANSDCPVCGPILSEHTRRVPIMGIRTAVVS